MSAEQPDPNLPVEPGADRISYTSEEQENLLHEVNPQDVADKLNEARYKGVLEAEQRRLETIADELDPKASPDTE